jgi:signal transduction histidine kinase
MSPDLAALVVHDLKNELGGLEALLQCLAASPTATLAQVEAHQQCLVLRQRFVQFLTLYGRDAQLTAHAVDESPVGTLASAARHAARARPDLAIELAAADQAPSFWHFDPRLVRMALDAALHNACRFAQRIIRMQARQIDGFLVLSVEDDGPGLGAAASDEGPQVHNTGMGRALCDAVARAHRCGPRQGHVQLNDRPEGGARFELWLA